MSKMESVATIANGFMPLTIAANLSILDITGAVVAPLAGWVFWKNKRRIYKKQFLVSGIITEHLFTVDFFMETFSDFSQMSFNLFHAIGFFQYPLKISENHQRVY